MADFIDVNGYFSKIWPSDDGQSYNAYFQTSREQYYIHGNIKAGGNIMPQQYQKANLHLKIARDSQNNPIAGAHGKGKRYFVTQLNPDLSSLPGLRRYLTSDIFDGIGEKTVDKLLDLYGEDVLTVIKDDPARMLSDGFKQSQIDTLQVGLADDSLKNVLMQLFPGLSQRVCEDLGDYYHDRLITANDIHKLVKTNVYQLFQDIKDADAMGNNRREIFTALDQYAMDHGVSPYAKFRVDTAIDSVVDILTDREKGTYLDLTDPRDMARFLHETRTYLWSGDMQKTDQALEDRLLVRCSYSRNKKMLYTREMLAAEINSARVINKMFSAQPVWPTDPADLDKKIDAYRTVEGHPLDDQQKEAVKMVMTKRLSVITGGPGTGKTTILNAIVDIWNRILPDEVFSANPPTDPNFTYFDQASQKQVEIPLRLAETILLAPTGKAAQRMNEKILARKKDAMTVALKLLRYTFENDPKRSKGPDTPYYKNKLAIIDEASMLSMSNAASLLKILSECQVVFVGDPDQLPPVGNGQFLQELITAMTIKAPENLTRLTTQHRTKNNTAILRNAAIVNNGGFEYRNNIYQHTPLQIQPGQFEICKTVNGGVPVRDDQIADMAVADYVKFWQQDPDGVCLITPMHPKSSPLCNDRTLNIAIQDIVNPELPQFSGMSNSGRFQRGKENWVSVKGPKGADIYWLGRYHQSAHSQSIPVDQNRGMPIMQAPYVEFPGSKKLGRTTTIRIGDRVMLTRNSYAAGMMNGDTGIVVGFYINPHNEDDPNKIIIKPDTPRPDGEDFCWVRQNRFDTIALAYCLTVHKTQGSEYRHVIMAMPEALADSPLANKNLLYTAITRAEEFAELLGTDIAIETCIGKTVPQRKTNMLMRVTGMSYQITDPDLSVFQ